MLHQIVEINQENRYLSVHRGFLSIKQNETHIAQIPLSDISVLVLSAVSITLSKPLLVTLGENNIIVLVCGKNYAPISYIAPITAHYQYAGIIKDQINVSIPFKKNIWKAIIQEKINNQGKTLVACEKTECSKKLFHIAKTVKSGDSDNREAYAARLYWTFLFGKDFKRDPNAEGINAILNYAYAIIRSAIIRSICASGLLPALGIHHTSSLNSFALADDLFEPFRPLADLVVYNLKTDGNNEITPEVKQKLIDVLWVKVKTTEGSSPLFQSFYYYAQSLVACFKNKNPNIAIPKWEGKYEELSLNE